MAGPDPIFEEFLREGSCADQMRMLSKLSHHRRQLGLVQRLGRQTECRRDFGGEGGRGETRAFTGDYGQEGGRRGDGLADEEQIGGHPPQSQIDINLFQRSLLGLGSAFISLLDPKRGDMVATMGETTVC